MVIMPSHSIFELLSNDYYNSLVELLALKVRKEN